MKAYIKGTIFDKNGALLEDREFEEAHSLLPNILKVLYVYLSQVAGYGVITSGAGAAISVNVAWLSVNAADNTTNYGILIGSGTTAPAFTDYSMTSQTVTSVYHRVVNFAINNPTANSIEIIISRTFQNNTGSILTISEVGLVSYQGSGSNLLMLDHTLYTVTVPIGGAITLAYKFTLSV